MKKSIICTFIFTVGILWIIWDNLPNFEENIRIQFHAKHEKGLEFRVFYTENESQEFIEERGFRQWIEPNESKILFSFKTSKTHRLRLDFGEFPGELSIKNLEIIGDKRHKITPEQLDQYAKSGIDSTGIKNDEWIVYSKQIFPHIAFHIETSAKKQVDILYLIIVSILLFGIVFKILILNQPIIS